MAMCALTFAQQKKVGWSLGYYPGWAQEKNPPANLNWASVTHIVHFTLFPNDDGTLDTAYCHINDAFSKAIVAEAHKHGVKCLIALGGAEVGTRFRNAASNANRGKLISNMIAFIKTYGYDGIDIDWEESFDNTLILALFKDMRDSLDKLDPKPLLTTPVAAYFVNNCYFVHPYVSQMNTMDYYVDVKGYPAQLKAFTDKGVPKSKLGLGLGIGTGANMAVHDSDMAKAIADFSIANGYGGIMEWTISTAALNTQVLKALVPYVPAPSTSIQGTINLADARGSLLQVRQLNPGNEIRYSVPYGSSGAGAFVDLSVYTLQGARVGNLVHGPSAGGTYSLSLDGTSGLARSTRSGSYVLRLNAGSRSESARITLTR
jgi:chitinase